MACSNARAAVVLTAAFALYCVAATPQKTVADSAETRALLDTFDGLLDAADSYQLAPGVRVKRSAEDRASRSDEDTGVAAAAAQAYREDDPEKYLIYRVARYAGTHVLDVDIAEMFRSTGRTFVKFTLREYIRKHYNVLK